MVDTRGTYEESPFVWIFLDPYPLERGTPFSLFNETQGMGDATRF